MAVGRLLLRIPRLTVWPLTWLTRLRLLATTKVAIKIKRKGLLHDKMGVPQGHEIPVNELKSKLQHAKQEHDIKLEKEIVFAINAHKFNHGGK
jgi:hypothetical protein